MSGRRPAVDERALRAAVAARAGELGDEITADEVVLEVDATPVAPGCRLFRARWGGGRRQRFLSGLLRDDDPPDTFPAQALEKVFDRWIEAGGGLPDARSAAAASAALMDPARRHEVVHDERDAAALPSPFAWQPRPRPPELTAAAGGEGGEGVTFWWVGPEGRPSVVGVHRTGRGRVRMAEQMAERG